MHLDGMESVEKLNAVKFKYEFPQYLFAQEGRLPLAVKEDNPE